MSTGIKNKKYLENEMTALINELNNNNEEYNDILYFNHQKVEKELKTVQDETSNKGKRLQKKLNYVKRLKNIQNLFEILDKKYDIIDRFSPDIDNDDDDLKEYEIVQDLKIVNKY
jgi:hypothetical protein